MNLPLWQLLLIAAVPSVVLVIPTIIMGRRHAKAIQEVHLSFNSRMDQFLQTTREASFAEGVKSEKDKK